MPSSSEPAATLDAAIADLPLLDEAGQAHPLRDLWAKGTAVVVFLRHFG